jgi:hypothetical protein
VGWIDGHPTDGIDSQIVPTRRTDRLNAVDGNGLGDVLEFVAAVLAKLDVVEIADGAKGRLGDQDLAAARKARDACRREAAAP